MKYPLIDRIFGDKARLCRRYKNRTDIEESGDAMVWILLWSVVGIIALFVYSHYQTVKEDRLTEYWSTPPVAPPKSTSAPTKEPVMVEYTSIYEYVGEKGKVRCYHCDGENDWSQHSCRICGNSLTSER